MDRRGSGWGTNSAYYNKWVAQENTDKCQLCFESKPADSELGAFSLELNRIQSFYFTKTKQNKTPFSNLSTPCSANTLHRVFDAVDHIVIMRTRLHHGLIFCILWMWDSEGTNLCYLKSHSIGQEAQLWKLQMTSLLKPRKMKWSVSTGSQLYIRA